MAVSGNLAHGRVKLPGAFERGVDIIRMLEHVDEWPEATGLYFIMPTGSRLINHTRFQLQPWYGDAPNELVGLWSNFLGLEFVMMIAAPNVLQLAVPAFGHRRADRQIQAANRSKLAGRSPPPADTGDL